MRTMQLVVGVSLVLACGYAAAFSAETKYVTKTDISYVDEAARLSDEYIKERCVLDIYYPEGVTGYSTIVWFHGGGLKNGNKSVLEGFKNKGLAVVAVNYRLYPKVKAPVYIEDAAASVAWVFEPESQSALRIQIQLLHQARTPAIP